MLLGIEGALALLGLESQKIRYVSKRLAGKMNKNRYELIQKCEKSHLLRHVIRFDKGSLFPELKW
jgi:hypothetical protein